MALLEPEGRTTYPWEQGGDLQGSTGVGFEAQPVDAWGAHEKKREDE